MQLMARPHLQGRAVSLHSLAISFASLGGFTMGMGASLVGVPAVVAAVGAGGHQLFAVPIRVVIQIQQRPFQPPMELAPVTSTLAKSD